MFLFEVLLVLLPTIAVKCELSCYGGVEAPEVPLPVLPKSCPNATHCIEAVGQLGQAQAIIYECDDFGLCPLLAPGWNEGEFMGLRGMIYCCSSSLCNKVAPPTRPTRVPPPVTQPKAGNLYLPYNVLILALVTLCRNV